MPTTGRSAIIRCRSGHWQDAIKAVFLDRVNIVSEYEDRGAFALVHDAAALRRPRSSAYVKPARHPAFTRFNVFLRDRCQCQYCGDRNDLTFDHVIPRSRGGMDDVGQRRGGVLGVLILPKVGSAHARRGLFPSHMPYQPTVADLHNNGRLFPPNYLHDSWMDYLYWDTELEP